MTPTMPDSPISVLRGISNVRQKLLKKLDIITIQDLVSHYPRGYENRGDIKKVNEVVFGEKISLILEIDKLPFNVRIPPRTGKKALSIQKLYAFDDTGTIELVFFNQNYLTDILRPGRKFRFYGQISGNILHPTMTSPEFEPCDTGKTLDSFVPIYPLTAGITSKLLQNTIKDSLKLCYSDNKGDIFDENFREKYNLCEYSFALWEIHFPSNKENIEKARRRLAFEELFVFQISLLKLGEKEKKGRASRFFYPDMIRFTKALPFTLTRSQKLAIQDILIDMTGVTHPNLKENISNVEISPTRRLIQGDVGSGKTVVAAAAVYACAENGGQSALMVPTGILAEQHYQSLSPLLSQFGISCALLTGSTKTSEKKQILKELSQGKLSFLIGTHALIEDTVIFKNLLLVITDEQHRFGVKQREKLSKKGELIKREDIEEKEPQNIFSPHVIVMSATPIPRTLAMILYGDMDISIINELPPGRQKVDTFAVGEDKRNRIYKFIRKQVNEGRQAYIVCPQIEQTEKEEEYIPYIETKQEQPKIKSALEHADFLQTKVFYDLRVAVLHGKMKPSEKDLVMSDFARGKIDILVSTTVIEVGVNVPNASVMLIENAERFGLSQLHQLRGRVGRGVHKSYCILSSPFLSDRNKNNSIIARLDIMSKTDDGFAIAQSDLEIRGPGEFFGKRQHGEMKFKIADIAADMALVEETRKAALEVFTREEI